MPAAHGSQGQPNEIPGITPLPEVEHPPQKPPEGLMEPNEANAYDNVSESEDSEDESFAVPSNTGSGVKRKLGKP